MSAEKTEEKDAGISRRTWCLGAVSIVVALGVGTLKITPANAVVRPPGGQDEGAFLASCIRCEKCASICPHDVIVPAHIEEGIVGVRTPVMRFDSNYCDFCEEANDGHPLCAQACPTQTLSLAGVEVANEGVVMGIAELNRDWCLAYRAMGCKSCYDACPFDAIGLDGTGRPYVLEDACNGCGACEVACVAAQSASLLEGQTNRAIVVQPTKA